MICKQFLDPVSKTFTYILASKAGAQAIIIDSVKENVEDYLEFLGSHRLKLVKAIDTHVHADHVTGMGELRKVVHCMTMASHTSPADVVSKRVEHGDLITFDGLELTVLETPGHTSDSICLYTEGMVFTGDTLFIRGNGRTDFQNGSPADLFDSITEKLFTLPDATIVFPGHDYKSENMSTIGREKKQNPRVAGKTKEEFCDIMHNLNLPNPKLMDVVIPLNLKVGADIHEGLKELDILSCEKANAHRGEAVFVDLRHPDEVAQSGSIPNALFLNFTDFDATSEDKNHPVMKALSNAGTVIFYCAFGERSALLVEMLMTVDTKATVYHMAEGINKWIALGYLVSGKPVGVDKAN